MAQPTGDGDCAYIFSPTDGIYREKMWNDVPCSNTSEGSFTYGFICEKR